MINHATAHEDNPQRDGAERAVLGLLLQTSVERKWRLSAAAMTLVSFTIM
ncbi:hypothetical protein ACVIHH_008348 [Bradyrhizobium sp. USDA 4518]